MFSYLRPHRRTPSTPTSPLPDQVHPLEPPLHHTADQAHQNGPRMQDNHFPQQRLPNTAAPPALGPVTRGNSQGYGYPGEFRYDDSQREGDFRSAQAPDQGTSLISTGFIADAQPRIPKQRPDSAGSSNATRPAFSQYRPQTSNAASRTSKDRVGVEPFQFVTITDLQQPATLTGRRAAAAQMSTPTPSLQMNVPTIESAQPRSGKTRLNLLNPMSLLARRRTQQSVSYPAPLALAQAEVKPSDGFDPRIRGTKVHDFSAPRPRRNVSSNDVPILQTGDRGNTNSQASPSGQYMDTKIKLREGRDLYSWSGGNHTPAFTEDFDDEQYPAAGPHVRRANDVSDLHAPQPPYAKDASLRYSDQTLRTNSTEDRDSTLIQEIQLSVSRASTLNDRLPALLENDSPRGISTGQVDSADDLPQSVQDGRKSASSIRARSRHTSQKSKRDSGLVHIPKHMQSTSSRFSFDMIGAASQEKLLEDRHRQRALEKKSYSTDPPDGYDNEVEDDFDYDNMDDDDGLEERIPGVNTDADDEDGAMAGSSSGIGGFTFTSMGISAATSPSTPYSTGMVSTPRDVNGEVIGFAITKESPHLARHNIQHSTAVTSSQLESDDPMGSGRMSSETGHHGLGLEDANVFQVEPLKVSQGTPLTFKSLSNPAPNDDDDLYFDDGIIDHPSDGDDTQEFDESFFDNDDTDEYGRPLRPLSSLPTLYSPPAVKAGGTAPGQEKDEAVPGSRQSQVSQEPISATSEYSTDGPPKESPKESTQLHDSRSYANNLKHSQSLTQDTLSAYQSALAAAAYTAAAKGRFRRDSSPAIYDDEREDNPGIIMEDSHVTSEPFTRQPLLSDDEDDFDYDDVLGDDDIIAEANAEALANDCDGFYGQEFGFYSAAASGDAQYGGFFGPRGANGITTNQNGRVASREPNLTPITERSEYSNRNSTMSLPMSAVSHGMGGLGSGSANLNSPGLAQLAGMMSEYDEEDISLNALLKLRRGAWGGSQASLHSNNSTGVGPGNASPLSAAGGGDSGSPVLEQSSLVQNSQLSLGQGFSHLHARGNSIAFSSGEASRAGSEVEDSVPASPILTMGMSFAIKQQPEVNSAASLFGSSASVGGGTRATCSDLGNSSSNLTGAPTSPLSLLSSLNSRPLSPTARLSTAMGMVSPSEAGNQENISFGRSKAKHQHSASSDSISYMKEDDPISGERWVLERRRTADTGEVEILGREVISSGRI